VLGRGLALADLYDLWRMLLVGSAIQVRKLKPSGALDFAWEGVVLRCDASGMVLRAEFNVDVVEREFATLHRGDVFVEFYYFERRYNVFQISSADGVLKGWYANLGLPAQLDPETRQLSYVDLALDVWANPDGSFVVLDDDELDELLEAYPQLTGAAEQGRAELIRLAESRQLPRWPE
jgi:uncharacterized protein